MPSNIIQINGYEKMTWIIPDSKMEKIIEKNLMNVVTKKILNYVGRANKGNYILHDSVIGVQ